MKQLNKTLLSACVALLAPFQMQAKAVDEALFFDPFVEQEMADISGKCVLETGLQVSNWVSKAVAKGAHVYGVEENELTLKEIANQILDSGKTGSLEFVASKMNALPFKENHFDCVLSACMGATLPSALPYVQDESENHLLAHCKEIARVTKEGGRIVVAAPASYATVFTKGLETEKAVQEIEALLNNLSTNPQDEEIKELLSQLGHINRATFVVKEGELELVKDVQDLKLGQQIWCVQPNGVFKTYYHSEEEYLIAFKQAGLFCEEIARPSFFGKVKYNMYHQNKGEESEALGEGYVRKNPFTLYSLVKPA